MIKLKTQDNNVYSYLRGSECASWINLNADDQTPSTYVRDHAREFLLEIKS